MTAELVADFSFPEGLVNRRNHGLLMRESLRAAAQRHVQVTLGKHFKDLPETRPGGPYGYTKRNDGYLERKRKRFGSTLPLVRTGKMRRFVRNNARITATRHRARVRLRNYFAMNADRRAELEAITPQEAAESREFARDHYVAEAARPKYRRKRKRRIK